MKIEVLKAGKWGINQPGPETIVLTEEQIGKVIEHDTLDMKTALAMEDADYINIVDDGEETDQDDPLDSLDDETDSSTGDVDIKDTLQKVIESADGKNAQKTALATWAKTNLNGFELDNRKSLEDCVAILVAEHGKLNG